MMNEMQRKNETDAAVPIIRTERLTFVYDDSEVETAPGIKTVIPALSDVDLTVRRGEYIAILGHNGSGKSTLAKLLNMILIPTSGRIFIDGREITAPDFSEDDMFAVREKVGMVFQNPENQLVATVVEEDVAFGPENLALDREQIRRRVDEALDLVDMRAFARHAPHKLSGGQKQRVAIAGIIAMRPEVIIFDESTAMLDPLGRAEVIGIMERLNREEGITVLNITHYMDEAARADRVIVINDGRLVMDGTAKEVFRQVDYLHGIGLEAPQGVELIHALEQEGISVGEDALTEEECVEALLATLTGKRESQRHE